MFARQRPSALSSLSPPITRGRERSPEAIIIIESSSCQRVRDFPHRLDKHCFANYLSLEKKMQTLINKLNRQSDHIYRTKMININIVCVRSTWSRGKRRCATLESSRTDVDVWYALTQPLFLRPSNLALSPISITHFRYRNSGLTSITGMNYVCQAISLAQVFTDRSYLKTVLST